MPLSVARTIDLGDARISYRVGGDGPPVVLVHGWSCCGADLGGVADALSDGHRVIVPDLPWHGGSTSAHADWPMRALGAAVHAVARAEGAAAAPVVGHSMGAAVAIEAALLGEGERVVALDGLTFMHMYPRRTDGDAAEAVRPYQEDFAAATRALCERACEPDQDPAFVDAIAAEMARMDPAAAVAILRELILWDMDAALDAAREKRIRVTVFAARPLLSDTAVRVYGERVEIVPVDLGGHFFPRTRPAKTAEIVRTAIGG